MAEKYFDRREAEELLPAIEPFLEEAQKQKRALDSITTEISNAALRIMMLGGSLPPFAELNRKKNQREKVGDLMVELKNVNQKKNLYTVSLYVDDSRYDKKNRSANEPIYFFTHGTRAPMEFTVNQIGKDKIAGYLSVPKVASAHAQASGN